MIILYLLVHIDYLILNVKNAGITYIGAYIYETNTYTNQRFSSYRTKSI